MTDRESRECVYCGGAFTGGRSDRRYCSRRCVEDAAAARRRAGEITDHGRKVRARSLDPERVSQRFWTKVEVRPDGCWLWIGMVGKSDGRPKFALGGKLMNASRAAWYVTFGHLPTPDQEVCHKCDEPLCVRPSHLFLGSHAENMADMARKRRASAKLTPEQVREIRAALARGESKTSLGLRYGVHRAAIYQLSVGKTYRQVAA